MIDWSAVLWVGGGMLAVVLAVAGTLLKDRNRPGAGGAGYFRFAAKRRGVWVWAPEDEPEWEPQAPEPPATRRIRPDEDRPGKIEGLRDRLEDWSRRE